MIKSEAQLLQFLDDQAIPYQRLEHPPVYTCDEAAQFRPMIDGVSTKNLFLWDKQDSFFLAMTACEKRLDLKHLARQVQVPKLYFGPEEKLEELLGVTRGAVTVLGLVNDVGGRVKLYVDAEVWAAEVFWCHPLVNTATLTLHKRDLDRFFAICGHRVHLF